MAVNLELSDPQHITHLISQTPILISIYTCMCCKSVLIIIIIIIIAKLSLRTEDSSHNRLSPCYISIITPPLRVTGCIYIYAIRNDHNPHGGVINTCYEALCIFSHIN